MKRKGLSWDGSKRRVIAAAILAAMMILPGIASARSGATSTSDGSTSTSATMSGRGTSGVSWS